MSIRRWGLGILLAVFGGAGAGFLGVPRVLPMALSSRGWTVDQMAWTGAGLLCEGIRGPGISATTATLGWDRRLSLETVTIDGAALRERVGNSDPPSEAQEAVGRGRRGGVSPPLQRDSGAGSGAGSGLGAWIVSARVDRLVVTGLPVDLPPLSGELLPTRHLTGEGVTIDDDHVTATVPTPWGEVTVEAEPGASGVVVTVDAPVLTFTHASLGPAPLVVEHVRADGIWAAGAYTGTVQTGDVVATVHAVPRVTSNPGAAQATSLASRDPGGSATTDATGPVPVDIAVHAEITLERADLAAVYALLGSLVPEGKRARIGGTMSATLTVDLPGPILHLTPEVTGFTVRGVLPAGYAAGPFRYAARDPDGERTWRMSGEGTAGWTPLAAVGPWLPAAIIASEDAGFWGHAGYDLSSMLEAAADNEARGETWRGGSTLTQQLAKNLFLDGSRTYARKARELLYAVDLERSLGKQRVLELYLNVVEWGPGIYGAGPAAETYFLKKPSGLLPEEAAWLASVLPSPRSAYKSQYLRNSPREERAQAILTVLEKRASAPEDIATLAAARRRGIHFVPP